VKVKKPKIRAHQHAFHLPPVFRPLILDNYFYIQEQNNKKDVANSVKRHELHDDDPPSCDILQGGIHELSLLQERHSHRIPWDFALRKGLRAYNEGNFSLFG